MLKINICKYMANASFYRLKIRTIDWWPSIDFVAGSWHYCWLVLWLVFDIVGWFCCWFLILLAGQNVIANIRIKGFCSIKVVGNCLRFPTKKNQSSFGLLELKIWAENRTVSELSGQVPTSPLFLRFELENGRFESWTLHESYRSMS